MSKKAEPSSKPRRKVVKRDAANSKSNLDTICADNTGVDDFLAMFDSLFGASHGPSGFRSKNRKLADAASEILSQQHPMTLRQLFYACISAGAIENKQAEYKRLGAIVTRLREEDDIPRTWIVDHVRTTLKPPSWSGLKEYVDIVRESYRLDFWAHLPSHVEIFCEKDATAGTMQLVTTEYDVPLRVCRGYSSISFAGEIADQWRQIEKPIFAYYCGDYDPSGFDIERDLREKLLRYSRRQFEWSRLAIREDDFDGFKLLALPMKRSDTRASQFKRKHGDRCAELDALPAVELRRRVEIAIRSHIPVEQWEALRKVEEVERRSIEESTSKWKIG